MGASLAYSIEGSGCSGRSPGCTGRSCGGPAGQREDRYWTESFHKTWWSAGSRLVGQRNLVSLLFPSSTLTHFDVQVHPGVRGKIALTIDDAPCRPESSQSMVSEIRALLSEFGATATFFVISSYLSGHEQDVAQLLNDGHEIANHCPEDRSYIYDSKEEFEASLLQAESACDKVRSLAREEGRSSLPEPPLRWFRSPKGQLNETMAAVVAEHGFTHVLTDCYANDPWISDPTFIAQTMLAQAEDGAIAVIHMPERGFREYTLDALRLFLIGLDQCKLQAVTLSALYRASQE